MKKETKKWIGGFITATILFSGISGITYKVNEKEDIKVIEKEELKISHEQDTWIRALEWCESQGKVTAINPNDKDGTPSYYSFQFKPSTFKYYGEKYSVINSKLDDESIKELLKKRELQELIVKNMLLDKSVNFRQQFPACVKKLGLPPKT